MIIVIIIILFIIIIIPPHLHILIDDSDALPLVLLLRSPPQRLLQLVHSLRELLSFRLTRVMMMAKMMVMMMITMTRTMMMAMMTTLIRMTDLLLSVSIADHDDNDCDDI